MELNVELKSMQVDEKPLDFPQSINNAELLMLLQTTAELATDEIFWIKADSEIIYVNNAVCTKLGYEKSDLIGMRVWEWDLVFSKEIWPSFWSELKTKKHIDFETKHQCKDGHIIPVRVKAHFIQNGQDELVCAFVSDISDIKNQELKLKQQMQEAKALLQSKSALLEQEKRKFEEFVNLAPVGIAINHASDGKFEYVNNEFGRFTGYTVDELNTMDYWQLTPKKYEQQELLQLKNMAEKGRYGPYQKEYIHKDGHTYPVLLSGIKIVELTGQDYIWSVVQDISQQKQNEQELEAAKEKADLSALRMNIANDSAGIGIWEWDLNTNELIWDEWMHTLYGRSKKQFSGAYDTWTSSVHPDDLDNAIAKLSDAINGTDKYDPEFRVIRPDGQIRTMKASAEVIKDDTGKPIRVIGVNYDITEKVETIRALEKAKIAAENASKAKSHFLANMSHEIRTPMNAILGSLQLLSKSGVDPSLTSILNHASYSAKSLLTVINDILDYSKIESNKLDLEQQPFLLAEVLNSVQHDLNSLISTKRIEFLTIIDENFIDGWEGDVVRVKQIVLNLASNAVKFTHKGQVKIEISHVNHGQNNAISLNITDTGIGMSEEAQAQVFERFTQADSSTTRKYGGTGLGMSICISLINLMGGTINLTSVVDQGTCIEVMLPLKAVDVKAGCKTGQSAAAPILVGKRILVAEDNMINQVIIESMLKETQAHVSIVENGKLACDAIQKEDFDLVLMDIHMPEMDGIEAQQKINALKSHIPVIALTANIMVEDVKAYIKQGFVSHVGKPIDMNELYRVLHDYIPK
ncbi:PAS domain S-box protein [Algibacillus agarilyticus]|uniref:PAS domain S-box protein n=1 Tax=Algibacillus agarilyticus TaxID=2234133 RepID=UPI0018E5A0C3|nr:PAS domain S-box protein [Algibacillus agarilyticus]